MGAWQGRVEHLVLVPATHFQLLAEWWCQAVFLHHLNHLNRNLNRILALSPYT